MFLAPVDIHGYILFNIIINSKIETNDSRFNDNLDSHITPTTEDLQAPTH